MDSIVIQISHLISGHVNRCFVCQGVNFYWKIISSVFPCRFSIFFACLRLPSWCEVMTKKWQIGRTWKWNFLQTNSKSSSTFTQNYSRNAPWGTVVMSWNQCIFPSALIKRSTSIHAYQHCFKNLHWPLQISFMTDMVRDEFSENLKLFVSYFWLYQNDLFVTILHMNLHRVQQYHCRDIF